MSVLVRIVYQKRCYEINKNGAGFSGIKVRISGYTMFSIIKHLDQNNRTGLVEAANLFSETNHLRFWGSVVFGGKIIHHQHYSFGGADISGFMAQPAVEKEGVTFFQDIFPAIDQVG
jgi:hypothetical protein